MDDAFNPDYNPFLDWPAVSDCTANTLLPHIVQPNAIQHVTFRLADSMPQEVLDEIAAIRDEYLRKHPEPMDASTKREFHRILTEKEQAWLDAGLGSCVLRHPECRRTLEKSISHHDGVDFFVLAYVIMPNHVHLLARMIDDKSTFKVISNIKKFTARQINKLLGREGALWQRECYDRVIRDESYLQTCVVYIQNNPRNLPAGEFSLFVNRDRVGLYK